LRLATLGVSRAGDDPYIVA